MVIKSSQPFRLFGEKDLFINIIHPAFLKYSYHKAYVEKEIPYTVEFSKRIKLKFAPDIAPDTDNAVYLSFDGEIYVPSINAFDPKICTDKPQSMLCLYQQNRLAYKEAVSAEDKNAYQKLMSKDKTSQDYITKTLAITNKFGQTYLSMSKANLEEIKDIKVNALIKYGDYIVPFTTEINDKGEKSIDMNGYLTLEDGVYKSTMKNTLPAEQYDKFTNTLMEINQFFWDKIQRGDQNWIWVDGQLLR